MANPPGSEEIKKDELPHHARGGTMYIEIKGERIHESIRDRYPTATTIGEALDLPPSYGPIIVPADPFILASEKAKKAKKGEIDKKQLKEFLESLLSMLESAIKSKEAELILTVVKMLLDGSEIGLDPAEMVRDAYKIRFAKELNSKDPEVRARAEKRVQEEYRRAFNAVMEEYNKIFENFKKPKPHQGPIGRGMAHPIDPVTGLQMDVP